MSIDLTRDTTLKVVRALDAGQVSSTEVLDDMIARIETHNPAVNAIVAEDVERAQAEAAAADDVFASGDERGPLHGLPMTIKDCYETIGLATTAGAPELAGHVPERDADVVRLLRRAGAIIWAKTNVPLYAGDHQTFNEVYGRTNNPWDLERTAGGSSGGAAAAVACGFTTAEVGSDIGGSIRQPASVNGVFGLKTTYGLVSGRGHIPGPPGALSQSDLGVFGPIGRSCGDLRLLLEVLTNSNTAFGGVPGASLPRLDVPADVAKMRVGYWLDDPESPVDAKVVGLLEGVRDRLAAEGASITEMKPAVDSAEAHETYARLLNATLSTGLSDEAWQRAHETAGGDFSPTDDPHLAFARHSALSHREWMAANEQRARLIAAWDDVFDQVDLVIAPIGPTPAYPHDTEQSYGRRTIEVNGQPVPYRNQLFWAGIATLPLLPSLALPAGTVDGLPVGMQLIGPRWSDHRLLAYGEEIASALGSRFTPPPMVA